MGNLPNGGHYSFDFGALDFLRSPTQKTVKTACGLRVPFSRITSTGRCLCHDCRTLAKQRIDDSLYLAMNHGLGKINADQETVLRELAHAAIVEAERLAFSEYFNPEAR